VHHSSVAITEVNNTLCGSGMCHCFYCTEWLLACRILLTDNNVFPTCVQTNRKQITPNIFGVIWLAWNVAKSNRRRLSVKFGHYHSTCVLAVYKVVMCRSWSKFAFV